MAGYCGFGGVCGDCNGVSVAIWVMHTGAKSGCKLVTLFSNRWLLLPYVSCRGHKYRSQIWVQAYDGVSAGVWVIHTGAKYGASW